MVNPKSYWRELWVSGPIRNEARRIARNILRKEYGAVRWDALSPKAQENHITVLLFNSEDVILNKARWNLENGHGNG